MEQIELIELNDIELSKINGGSVGEKLGRTFARAIIAISEYCERHKFEIDIEYAMNTNCD